MKNYCCYWILILLTSTLLFAQEDEGEIIYSEESGTLESGKFANRFNYLLRDNTQQINWLKLTGGLGSFLNDKHVFNHKVPLLNIIYERKIGQAISLNNELGFFFQSAGIGIIGVIEPRYYYNMKEQIESGLTENNLSGNYVGFPVSYHYYDEEIYSNVLVKSKDVQFGAIGFVYGIQRRFSKRGFLDFSIGPQIAYGQMHKDIIINNEGNKVGRYHKTFDLSLRTNIRIGMLLFYNKDKNMQDRKFLEIFKYDVEEDQMFKINLTGIIRQFNNESIAGRINPAYEFKLSDVFSINTDLDFSYNYLRYHYPQVEANEYRFDYSFRMSSEVRYYYNLKKRIAIGKSVNNMSANYMAFNINGGVNRQLADDDFFQDTNSNSQVLNIEFSPTQEQQYVGWSFKWGIQRRIFIDGYFDFSVGAGIRTQNEKQTGIPRSERDKLFQDFAIDLSSLDFKIGLAF